MKKLYLGILLLLCLVLSFSSPAFSSYSQVISFGDSLSDNGPADGYGIGVSSNGPVWVDSLAGSLGVGLLDMAYGGARTDYHPTFGSEIYGFGWQIAEYIDKKTFDTDALYTVWIGGNDLLNITGDPAPVITNAVTNIALGLNTLIGKGAENILILNMPNLGLTPLMNGANTLLGAPFSDTPALGTGLALGFNTAMDQAIDPFRSMTNLMEVDIFTLMSDFIADGLFDNYQNMLKVDPTSSDRYLFWDAIHPTTYAHGLIADEALLVVAPVPIPSTIGLLYLGLLGFAGVNRRKK